MNFLIIDEVGSTNDYAKELILQGKKHGFAVLAKRQTNGRGQYNRTWFDTEGGLFMSVIIDMERLSVPLNDITVYVGEKVKRYLEEITGYKFNVKLPNDILFDGKKICGILTEMTTRGKKTMGVVGIGINVNNRYFPDEIKDNATSLFMITNKEYDIETVGRSVANAISN